MFASKNKLTTHESRRILSWLRNQTDIRKHLCQGSSILSCRVADSSARRQKGEGKTRTEADSERVKSVCERVPTLPCWRHLSPPEADCHPGAQKRSSPKPWGQPPIRTRWTPLCSSCVVLLHCPQPELSICTFVHSGDACVTHSQRVIPMEIEDHFQYRNHYY